MENKSAHIPTKEIIWPEELCDGNHYTIYDRQICDFDCRVLNNCRKGIVPKTTSIKEVRLYDV